jgi:hypothetical protein
MRLAVISLAHWRRRRRLESRARAEVAPDDLIELLGVKLAGLRSDLLLLGRFGRRHLGVVAHRDVPPRSLALIPVIRSALAVAAVAQRKSGLPPELNAATGQQSKLSC